MSLADAAVRIRPRGAWEGLDLGCAMARRWLPRLWLLWWLPVAPLAVLLVVVFGEDAAVTYLLLWWAKPLYEWALVHWLSQKVFATHLSLRETLQVFRPARLRALLPYLLWRRFTLHRSFTMPIGMLEGLRGAPRAARADILARGQNAVVWLMIVCMHFEMVLNVGMFMTLVFFGDNEYGRNDFIEQFFYLSEGLPWLSLGVLLLTWSVLAPFYVAAGFAAYLTRRTELEAWDLELVFRALAPRLHAARRNQDAPQAVPQRRQRRRTGSGLVLVLAVGTGLSLGLGVPPSAVAAPPPAAETADAAAPAPVDSPAAARELIDEVIARDEFGEYTTVSSWRYRGGGDEEEGSAADRDRLSGLGAFLGLGLELFLWLALFALAIWGGYYLINAMGWLAPRREAVAPDLPAPAAAAGPGPLPADIPAAVAALLQADRRREALALLYCASLARLTAQGRIEVPESATEGECRQLVRRHCPRPVALYFDGLARAWIQAAYGMRLPERAVVEQLHQLWPRIFREAG